MLFKFLDSKRVAGFLHVNFPFLVPSNKRVSFHDLSFIVGYTLNGKFIQCHQTDDYDIAKSFCLEKQSKVPYKVVIVRLMVNTSIV